MLDRDRVHAREKLSKTENKLSGVIYERGVNDQGFSIIRSEGDKALFGGYSTLDMKRKFKAQKNATYGSKAKQDELYFVSL